MSILVGRFQFHDVAVTGEVMHDLNLTPDIFHVVLVYELSGGDRLAGELLSSGFVGYEIGNAELAAPEFSSENVSRADVFHWAAQNSAHPHPQWSWWGLLGGGEDVEAFWRGLWLGLLGWWGCGRGGGDTRSGAELVIGGG